MTDGGRGEDRERDGTLGGDEPHLVCTVNVGTEVMGYVVIDATVAGRACGGVRIAPDVDEAEVRALASAMTLKFGLLGLPQGGAKAGIRGDSEAPPEERWRLLTAFGQAISPLLQRGVYQPATDIGTDLADVRQLLQAAGVALKRREQRVERTGYYTAVTVFAAAKQAARHLGLELAGATAAVEGFGKVGGDLAVLLADAGVRVVAVSTSRGAIYNPQGLEVARLTRLSAEAGSRSVELYPDAERIDLAALLELPVDLLCPCARQDSVHAGNVARIAARIVAPGANDPVTPEAERGLFERGVVVVPDFVANCGGVLGGTMAFAAIDRATIAAFMGRRLGERIAWFLEEAARRGVPPREVAAPYARRRFEEMRKRAARSTVRGRVLAAGLAAHRRGWVPERLVANLSLPYFERALA